MEIEDGHAGAESPRQATLHSRRGGAAEQPLAELAAAWLGGFAAGTAFILLSLYVDDLGLTLPLLLVGVLWLGVWFRHFGSMVGAVIAIWFWQTLLTTPRAPTYCDFMCLGLGRDEAVAFVGTIAPVVAHGISMLLRRGPGRQHEVRVVLLVGLASILVFSATAQVQTTVPASRSFELSLPAGWTTYRPAYEEGDRIPAMYGADFSAVLGQTPPPSDLRHPPAEMLGVSVYSGSTDPQGTTATCDIWSVWGDFTYETHGPPIDWNRPHVDIPGASLQAFHNDASETFYVLEASRTRQVGLAFQRLCYLVVVSLPPVSSVSQSDVGAIMASFHYR